MSLQSDLQKQNMYLNNRREGLDDPNGLREEAKPNQQVLALMAL